MKTKNSLKILIDTFSQLKNNWGSYNEDVITIESIMSAHKVIDELPDKVDIQTVDVFPMRNGGIQIEIGEFKEITVFNHTIIEIEFDSNLNILNKCIYELN